MRNVGAFLFLFGVMGGSGTVEALAEDSMQIATREESHRVSLAVTPEYITFSNAGKTINGTALGLGVSYGYWDRFGFGARLSQAFYVSAGLWPIYTAIELRFVFALTGSLVQKSEIISMSGAEVYSAESENSGGFRFQLSASQFLFNSSVTVLPFSGMGGVLSYEYPIGHLISLTGGVGGEWLTSGKTTFTPIHVIAGLVLGF